MTCACAGLVEAIHVVAGYFALHPEIKTALVCAANWRDRVTYDLQTLDDVANLAAGLTLGNAAAAFLVARESLPAGSARLLGFQHKTLAEHYDLCSAPVDGHFVSRSKELFALAVHVPGEVRASSPPRAGRPKTSTTTSSTSPARRSWSASSTHRCAARGVRAYALDIWEYRQYLMGGRAQSPSEARHRQQWGQARDRKRRIRVHDVCASAVWES